MKLLSQMTTDEAMEVMCCSATYVSNMSHDKELLAQLKGDIIEDIVAKKMSRSEIVAAAAAKISEKIFAVIPILFEKHKSDVLGILAAFKFTTPEAIAKQSFMETMNQIKALVNDREFWSFFKSAATEETSE